MNVPAGWVQIALPASERGRRWLSAILFLGCAGVAAFLLWRELVQPHQSVALRAFIAGSVAAGATAVGTLPILFARTISARIRDVLLGFGAGVMLAASAFSLVIPALDSATALGAGKWTAGLTVAAGMLIGALMLLALDRYVPHEHFIKGAEGSLVRARALRRTWLFVFAIALHNLPEGLAIGVAYAGPDSAGAAALATGISIQDFPEGLVIALALLTAGYGRGFSILLGAASGIVEPIAAAAGAAIISASAMLLPWGLAIAAGAMLFVISHEIIPESHRQGHERSATLGLMFGFVVMMVLDTAL